MPTASYLLPLWDRATEWTYRLEMIRDATHFLYLSTYYIEYDAYGIELLAALLEAQRRGVEVNLLIDDFGQRLGGVLMAAENRGRLTAQLDELTAAGAIVTRYKPTRVLQRWLGGGQHVKIQVSEAGDAIFGSSNITKSSYESWNEYSVILRGPIAAILLKSYRAIGGVVTDAHVSLLTDSVAPTTNTIHLDYWLCNPNTQQGALGPLGWQEPNEVTDRLIEMIETAQENIRLTSFYFKPVESLLYGVIAAANRGVQVEVYHSHRDALPATDLAWIAATARYEQLLDAGVQIYENLNGEHSKIVLIDADWVAFGSYNFEDAAHDRLAEAMLATHDPQVIAHTVSIFDRLKNDPSNMSVTKQLLRQLPTNLKLKRALLCPFKRWL